MLKTHHPSQKLKTNKKYDGEMAARADAAAATGGVLRYVGVVDAAAKTASVTLQV
jgi:hypothetical protein